MDKKIAQHMKEIIKDLQENTLVSPVVVIFPDGCPEANWKPRELSAYPDMKGEHIPGKVAMFFPAMGNLDMYLEEYSFFGFRVGLRKATRRHKIIMSPIYKDWKLLVQACLQENIPFVFVLPKEEEKDINFLFHYHDEYLKFMALNNDENLKIPSDIIISDSVANIKKFAAENPNIVPIIETIDIVCPDKISDGKVLLAILIRNALYEGRYVSPRIFEE